MAEKRARAKAPARASHAPTRAELATRRLERELSERALKALAEIMESGESEAARVTAAKSVLDRCAGKGEAGEEADGLRLTLTVKFV